MVPLPAIPWSLVDGWTYEESVCDYSGRKLAFGGHPINSVIMSISNAAIDEVYATDPWGVFRTAFEPTYITYIEVLQS